MDQVRLPADLQYIIIHHTGNTISGLQENSESIQEQQFGTQYDIIINPQGAVDLSPRWIFALQATQYLEDVGLKQLTSYSMHHLSTASETAKLNRQAIHIAMVGNFDAVAPHPMQISKLISVLQRLCKVYVISVHNILYHQSSASTSCPGNLFIVLQDLVSLVSNNS